ncbi:protein EXORDIUM-like 4 [Abrus precatorius]|uniref:Protein EXORDIUM-like 4 n=1 Tax=Abrus precatorius TaxID=3816 RepID=A0A8B8MMD2_ABRPR|nr:protein EXORDIUM-like 4 [Abrus precatorius]
MALAYTYSFLLFLLFLSPNTSQATSRAPNRMLAMVQQQPLVLKYHKGPLLKGNITLHLIWYGAFTPTQRSIILDFIQSLSAMSYHSPSVFSWWQTTQSYRGGPSTLVVGNQILDHTYSLGKSLKTRHLLALASNPKLTSPPRGRAVHVILTSADVVVEDFCMNQCGTHGSGRVNKRSGKKIAYAWVGNPVTQCPGQCAWPFHQPVYGPQTAPLVSPNADVGIDGIVINLATVLAGVVTNPAPLEAVSACTGVFGKGAYPGYAGNVLVEKTTGASYNAVGVRGRKFLLPAMWDPRTSACKTLV